jgi:mannose-6-phosphate isomerase-like protein (cupin superfamily)
MEQRVFNINEDSQWVPDPPKHEDTTSYPLINPKTCPGAQLEFHITEIHAGKGRALDDVHENEDHVFYVLSGHAAARVGEEVYRIGPGDALWVPKNTLHNFMVIGGETFRIAVVFAPARGFWVQPPSA